MSANDVIKHHYWSISWTSSVQLILVAIRYFCKICNGIFPAGISDPASYHCCSHCGESPIRPFTQDCWLSCPEFFIVKYWMRLIFVCPCIVDMISWLQSTRCSCFWLFISTCSATIPACSSIGWQYLKLKCTVICSWWWAEEPPETCRAL